MHFSEAARVQQALVDMLGVLEGVGKEKGEQAISKDLEVQRKFAKSDSCPETLRRQLKEITQLWSGIGRKPTAEEVKALKRTVLTAYHETCEAVKEERAADGKAFRFMRAVVEGSGDAINSCFEEGTLASLPPRALAKVLLFLEIRKHPFIQKRVDQLPQDVLERAKNKLPDIRSESWDAPF